MKAIALELMHEMLGLFHAFTGQNAFALLVDLEHVKLRFLSGPTKNLLEDMGDVIHVIDRIIPTNYQKPRLQPGTRFILGFLSDIRPYLRCCCFDHSRKIKEKGVLVESRQHLLLSLSF